MSHAFFVGGLGVYEVRVQPVLKVTYVRTTPINEKAGYFSALLYSVKWSV